MSKTVLTIGMLAVASALSICDLCEPGAVRPVTALASAAHAAPAVAPAVAPAAQVVTPAADPKTVTFRVEGMTCGGCVIGVRKVLTRLEGVVKADVSYEKRRAVVTYDPAKVTVEQMIAAIKTLGYKATVLAE